MIGRSRTIAAFATACVLAAFTTDAAAQDRPAFTLKIGSYGGAFTAAQKKYVGDIFTQSTGIKVQYIDGSATDMIAKLVASKGREPPFDVVYLEKDIRDDAIDAGILAKLDPSIVTNLQYTYNEAKSPQGYGPGMGFYSVGIAYNTKKFQDAGIPAPTSWNDLWDPRLAGRVAIPDITTSYGREFLVMATRLKGATEKNPEVGLNYIATLNAHSYFSSSAQLQAQFLSADVWAAPWINSRTWGMIDRGAPLRYVLPKEGGIGNINTIDLVAGTPHAKEAQLYINMSLDPLAQLGTANDNPLGPTNKVLVPVLKAYPEMAKHFPATPEDLAQLYLIDWDAYRPHRQEMVAMWNRVVTGK